MRCDAQCVLNVECFSSYELTADELRVNAFSLIKLIGAYIISLTPILCTVKTTFQ